MVLDFPIERIIYQDADILVVNKPEGLLTIPDGYDPSMPNLAALLSARFGKVWVVHRLDKDTSGLLLFALNLSSHQELNRQFRERLVQKVYLAMATPVPAWEAQSVSLPLQINAGRSHLTKVGPEQGKPAETVFNILEKKTDTCLLECRPKTGYRHQIRAHLYAQGMGIIGDSLYNPSNPGVVQANAPRLMLQAQALNFTHPGYHESISFEIPMDSELENYWNALA